MIIICWKCSKVPVIFTCLLSPKHLLFCYYGDLTGALCNRCLCHL